MMTKKKTIKKELLLIDGNHMLHRAYYKYARMRTLNGVVTSMIFGFPYILRGVVNKFKPDKLIVVFDGKNRSKHRLKALPNYKNREAKLGFDKDDFVYQKLTVIKILKSLGVSVVISDTEEGDDMIYLIYKRLRKKYNVTLVSGDKDFHQLLTMDGSFKQWDATKAILYTYKNIEGRKGYKPSEVVDYLTLLGDASDKIPGYKGIGEKKAIQFIKEFGSIKKFLADDNATYSIIDKEILADLYKLNRMLIDLKLYYRKYLRNYKTPWVYKNPKFNKGKLLKFAQEFEIGSFVKSDFVKTFKSLKK